MFPPVDLITLCCGPTASGLDAVLITLQRKPPSNNPLFRAEHYSSVCLDAGD